MTRTVLVADDSPTIQKRASLILANEGIEVITVSNGVAAIKKLDQVQPFLIIADVSMPGKDGYEVCDFVKKSPAFSQLPVVLLVSELEPYDEERGARVHADGKINKPFDRAELIGLVQQYLARPGSEAPTTFATAPLESATELASPPELETLIDDSELGTQDRAVDLMGMSEGVPLSEPLFELPAQPAVPVGEMTLEAPPATSLEDTQPVATKFSEETVFSVDSVPYERAPVPGWEVSPEPAVAPSMEGESSIAQPEIEAAPPFAIAPPTLEETPPARTEYAPAPAEEASERTMLFRMPAEIVEPVLQDEPTSPATSPAVSRERPGTDTEGTMVFRVPSHIAEPVLHDELAPPPPPTPEVSAAPIESTIPSPAWPTTEPGVAASLEGFSLEEASSGQVRLGQPGAPTLSSAEESAAGIETVAPSHEAAAPARDLDYDLIYTAVRKTVTKMAGPAFATEHIEDLVRKLYEEVAGEIAWESSQPKQ